MAKSITKCCYLLSVVLTADRSVEGKKVIDCRCSSRLLDKAEFYIDYESLPTLPKVLVVARNGFSPSLRIKAESFEIPQFESLYEESNNPFLSIKDLRFCLKEYVNKVSYYYDTKTPVTSEAVDTADIEFAEREFEGKDRDFFTDTFKVTLE